MSQILTVTIPVTGVRVTVEWWCNISNGPYSLSAHMIVRMEKGAGYGHRLALDSNSRQIVCCIYGTCVHTSASPLCERPMCLAVADLMTPLTGLIHTQVLVHIWKNNTHGNPTNRESVVSVRLELDTFRVGVLPALIVTQGQNRILCVLLSERHNLACFHIRNLECDTFQKQDILNPTQFLSYSWGELGPKMVNARKGVVWPENHRGGADTRWVEREYNGTRQNNTHLSTPVFLFELVVSHRKCPPRFPWGLLLLWWKPNRLLIKQKGRTEHTALMWLEL